MTLEMGRLHCPYCEENTWFFAINDEQLLKQRCINCKVTIAYMINQEYIELMIDKIRSEQI